MSIRGKRDTERGMEWVVERPLQVIFFKHILYVRPCQVPLDSTAVKVNIY